MWLRWLMVSLLALAQAAHAEVAPWDQNSRYWMYDGAPVLLVGPTGAGKSFLASRCCWWAAAMTTTCSSGPSRS